MCLSYTVYTTYGKFFVESRRLSPTPLAHMAQLGVTPSEFLQEAWRRITGVHELLCGSVTG